MLAREALALLGRNIRAACANGADLQARSDGVQRACAPNERGGRLPRNATTQTAGSKRRRARGVRRAGRRCSAPRAAAAADCARRSEMLLGAMLAGQAFANAPVAAVR